MKVKKPNYKKVLVNENANTDDILKEVLAAIRETDSRDILPFLKENRIKPTYDGMENLWNWAKKNIAYKEDSSESQSIQNANYTYYERASGTDCKSFTVFMCKCFEALNLDYKVRFAGYKNNEITHVYPIVILPDNENIIMDAVWVKFNSEKKYQLKKDFSMSKIFRISGHRVGNFLTDIGDMIKNKTVNKFAALFLMAYYPYPLKAGSPTAIKVEKVRKAYQWFLRNSPIGKRDTDLLIRQGISEKIDMKPEEFFKKAIGYNAYSNVPDGTATGQNGGRRVSGYKVNGIGCVDGVTTAACLAAIVAIIGALVPLFLALINRKSKAELEKDDVVPNLDQMKLDNQQAITAKIEATTPDPDKPTDGDKPNEGKADNTMLYVGGAGLVAAYFIFKD